MLPNLSALSAPTGGTDDNAIKAMGRPIVRRNARRGGRAPPSTEPPPYDEPWAEGIVWEPGLDPPADFELPVRRKWEQVQRAKEAYETAPADKAYAAAMAWSNAAYFLREEVRKLQNGLVFGVAPVQVFMAHAYWMELADEAYAEARREVDKHEPLME